MKQNEQQTIYTEINQLSVIACETESAEPLTDLPVTVEQTNQPSGGPGNTYSGTTTINQGTLLVR